MNMPFCDVCPISNKCIPDTKYFYESTGNKRIPPQEYCKKQFEANDKEFDNFYLNNIIKHTDNLYTITNIYPEFQEFMEENNLVPEYTKMPLNITLMLTEKCNLKCKYCYEVFSGNMKAKSMTLDMAEKIIDLYVSEDQRSSCENMTWDFIGGELFTEFDLVKNTIDYLIKRYSDIGLCPRRYLALSLCTNGTLFTPEIKKWCEQMINRVSYFGIGVSLDGPKHVHDINRCNSFDRVMESFKWLRANFPQETVKGTLNPDTVGYLSESVKFYVEELKLPKFFINPTFEGPWNEELATVYSEQLIECAHYFLDHPEYRVLENSNLFFDTRIKLLKRRNWCGSGLNMRAFTPDGSIYPCIRAATSRLHKIGNVDNGVDINKIIPFFFYTTHNDIKECDDCRFINMCPSCVMEWVENTNDMYVRSINFCLMTKAKYLVSELYCNHAKEVQGQSF